MPNLEAPKRFSPVGQCIYCGALGTDVDLTDEHIIPFALAGDTILPKSSCKDCARVTGAVVEQQVLRRMFGVVRAQRDLPTRRPRERPTLYKLEVDLGTTKEEREEPLRFRPRVFSIPMFPFPTILSDMAADESGQISGITLWTVSAREDIDATAKRHPDGKRFTVRAELPFALFARMLAKIGHAHAVAEYGMGSFVPLLPPLILGRTLNDSFNHLVGSTTLIPPKEREMSRCHLIRMRTIKTGTEYLVAEIRIFGDLGMPVHLIVIGPSKELREPLRFRKEAK